ncbi:hypothetical protein DPMN_004092 [Dreissena polymorpha]|uniref:Uncharacterized protein n=1 Tax=Dreissena polymorpha TaxID=45954 RepID=A0A9D4MS10_DREPO|nr:hypothetical protein DPMN_004092 [Dreissena polymorpha]
MSETGIHVFIISAYCLSYSNNNRNNNIDKKFIIIISSSSSNRISISIINNTSLLLSNSSKLALQLPPLPTTGRQLLPLQPTPTINIATTSPLNETKHFPKLNVRN